MVRNGQWPTRVPAAEAFAFVGVRACELAAIQIQDRVFLREDFADATYRARRNKVFILAVNCLHPAGTCFCATMGTGPEAESGFDLCLTELDDHFLVKIGSALGRDIMQDVAFRTGQCVPSRRSAAGLAGCGRQGHVRDRALHMRRGHDGQS